MKKRPTIIFDSTLKDVLVDDNIFIVEQQDDGDSNKDGSNKNKSNKDDQNDDAIITNELKRQIVNI